MAVRYFGGLTEVQLGDRVSITLWFRRHAGRVVYVPGISPVNAEFEYNGLQWVGIRLENHSLVATIVRPKSGTLKEKVRLMERDTSPCQLITNSSKEFEEHGEGTAV